VSESKKGMMAPAAWSMSRVFTSCFRFFRSHILSWHTRRKNEDKKIQRENAFPKKELRTLNEPAHDSSPHSHPVPDGDFAW
jgi:hypothetical protein